MNEIRKSLSKIQATEDLKKNTLQYLLKQQEKKRGLQHRPAFKYALAAICMFFLLSVGGYSVYRQPVSYISIDVNPSVELGINRFGRVVSTEAYNEDGQTVLQQLSLKNIPYVQAIHKLLENKVFSGFLKEDSLLVFTVISSQYASILEELSDAAFSQNYETLLYTSDISCMEEAHSYEMSFGKYRGYQELLQYDTSVTVEDCHDMTMEEIHRRIESCSGHQDETGSHHGTSHTGTPDTSQTGTSQAETPDTSQTGTSQAGTPDTSQTGTSQPAGDEHHGSHHE